MDKKPIEEELELERKKFDEISRKARKESIEVIHLTEELRAEKDIFYFMAENVADGFWDWHIQDDYEYISPKLWESLGQNPSEKKPHPSELISLMNPIDAKKALNLVGEHFKSKGKIPYDQVIRYNHKDGHVIRIRCQGKVVTWSDDNKPIRMLGIHTDVTNLTNGTSG